MSIDAYPCRSSPSMDYPSMGYLGSTCYPKWKNSSSRSDMQRYQLINLYGVQPIKHQPTSRCHERPLSYANCSSCYPYCGAMLETHPCAFHARKPLSNPFDVPSESSDRPCLSLYYEDQRMCTCYCPFPTCRSPPSHESLYKREDGRVADQQERGSIDNSLPTCYRSMYQWFLPNRHYSREDTPISLRLSSLTSHAAAMSLHDDEKRPTAKRFRCPHCEKSFGKSSHLRDHIRTHTGDRPYQCKYCDKAFTQYSNLRTHTRIHTGEKPYRCRHCNKSFTQAVTLRSHTRTHTGDKPYHCKHCTKSFACFSGLKAHIRVHDGDRNNTQITQTIKHEDMRDVARSQRN